MGAWHFVLIQAPPVTEVPNRPCALQAAWPLRTRALLPLPAHRLCFQALRTSFSLLFLMLATEKTKRYLYVSTHFRSCRTIHGALESKGQQGLGSTLASGGKETAPGLLQLRMFRASNLVVSSLPLLLKPGY